MNDVREAINRIGELFDPPTVGLGDLARCRDRARARRRVTAACLALVITSAGLVLTARAFWAQTREPAPRVRLAASWPAPRSAAATEAGSGSTSAAYSGWKWNCSNTRRLIIPVFTLAAACSVVSPTERGHTHVGFRRNRHLRGDQGRGPRARAVHPVAAPIAPHGEREV